MSRIQFRFANDFTLIVTANTSSNSRNDDTQPLCNGPSLSTRRLQHIMFLLQF